MVGMNLKEETMKLMDKRSALEGEIDAIIQRLSQPGGPGVYDDLIDSEGFPREDIDIPAVRADRCHLAELKNDHIAITEKISQNIQLLHTAKPSPKSRATSTSENHMEIDGAAPTSTEHGWRASNPNPAETNASTYIPFALVDEIAESSPAAEDGLQLGDQIVKFGSVESGVNMLQMVAQEVQRNQGSAIPVTIKRHGALSSLSITPRTWQGRGLLGCHFELL